jgi:hypothetical protein
MPMTLATRAAERIGPARLLQSRLTILLLGAIKPLVRRQRETFLELNAAADHRLSGAYVPA